MFKIIWRNVLQIVWTKKSINNLDSIDEYISKDNPVIAAEVVMNIFESVQKLKNYPGLGRQGRVEDTRELVISKYPYVVPYRIEENVIFILRVVHTSMKWPNLFST